MGAFDSYTAEVACPACGDLHHIRGQTKLFDPDYDEQRWFEPGARLPAAFTAAQVPDVADSWVRIRPRGDDTHVTLLCDFDDMSLCGCGRWLAKLLCFVLEPGFVTLERIELLDGRTSIAERVDYADADSLWDGDVTRFAGYIAAFNARSFEERAAWLRARLNERFQFVPDDEPGGPRWRLIVGPTQCEACGDVRERTNLWWDLGAFFDPPLVDGPLFFGARLPFDDRWLDDDVDRARFLRARHPVATDQLALLGMRLTFGCRCGAGMARMVARFERQPGALVLQDVTLRVVTGFADIRDIDFIEGVTRDEHHTRAWALGWTLR